MGRSPLFRVLRKTAVQAQFLNQKPEFERFLHEGVEAFQSKNKIDRRQFLTRLSQTGILLATTPLSSFAYANAGDQADWIQPINSSSEPVVILGAGIAGLVTAYRLNQLGIPNVIYEASPRIGGRIWTQKGFNQNQFIELGAELIDTEHTALLKIMGELGVEAQDLSQGDQGFEPYYFYFQGQRRGEKEFLEAYKPLAVQMAQDIRGIYKNKLRECDYRKHTPVAAKFDRISIEEYLNSKTGVEQWVKDAVSCAYVTEFGIDAGLQSAMNLLTMIGTETENRLYLFGSSDESKRIQGGNSQIIAALEKAIAPYTPVHLNHRFTQIRWRRSRIELTFEREGSSINRLAHQIVCTVPFSILRNIQGIFQIGMTPTKQRCIRELGMGNHNKYMLGFHEKTWRKKNQSFPASAGYSFTDLPSQNFWETSRNQEGTAGSLTNYTGGSQASVEPSRQSTLADLEKLFPGIREQFNGSEALFRWGTHRFTQGSYSACTVGQWTTLMGSAHEPELEGQILFAGEHASEDYQGYMNGSVETALRAADSVRTLRQPQPESA